MYQVMIVDDEQLTRTFLSKIIPKLNSQWIVSNCASDGAEALELLSLTPVDLVITDVKMPIMNGITLCKRLHETYPEVHLILLSGYGEFDYAQKAICYEVTNYLLKPINNDELALALSKITNLLDKKKDDNRSLKDLIGLSNMFKEEIAVQFLQAVIHDSYVKTQALLPIINEHHKDLMTEEGIILLLVPSKSMFSRPNYLKNQDISNLLIYQTTLEELKGTPHITFLDLEGRTVIYTTFEHETSIQNLVTQIFLPVSKAFHLTTNYDLDCFFGETVSELLQLSSSYKTAISTMFLHYITEESSYQLEQSPATPARNQHYQFYNSKLDMSSLTAYDSLISSYIYAVKSQDPLNIKHAKANILQIPDNYCYYMYFIFKNSYDYNSAFSPKAFTLIHLLDAFENSQLTLQDELSEDSLVEEAKQYIHQHYDEPISLSIIAEHLSISPSYLSNIFHERVGISYIKYLTDLRLKEACLLLRNHKNMTLETITQKVGYVSVKHFSYVFKNQYQMTPGQYRKTFDSWEDLKNTSV